MLPPDAVVWRADLVLTLGIAALLLRFGAWFVTRMPWLARTNIPAPAVAGLLFALAMLAVHRVASISIDTSLRAPLQSAFFATIGFQATGQVLRTAGVRALAFWAVATGTAVVQNAVGLAMAAFLGVPLLVGVICGSLTLTGGPATGLAFAGAFERAGIEAAAEVAIAAATFGILLSNLVGNPVATWLIRRWRLAIPGAPAPAREPSVRASVPLEALPANVTLLLAAVGLGAVLDRGFRAAGLVLPNVIAPMILAAAVRALEDWRPRLGFHPATMDAIGSVTLSFFLVIALCDLKLWQLAGLALPMLSILTLQVVATVAYAIAAVFWAFGRDYEAAALVTGHIGFALGITPNAMANLESLTARFGAAPRAYLMVPMVGGFLVDFPNALLVALLIRCFSA